jgi:hypothetical protein
MTRRGTASVLSADLLEVIKLFQARGIMPASPPAEMIQLAQAIHSSTYSLVLWRFRLRSLPPHGRVFLDEIASDAIQVLPQVVLGFSKTSKLLVRGIAENVLRHIYFSDHPVEFARMNRDAKWYLSVDSLCEYAKNHPQFIKTEPLFDALGRITSLYSELSAGVHGRTVRDLEMRTALKRIKFDTTVASKDADMIRRCAAAVNFLLAIFHWARVRKFALAERSLILRTMPAGARNVWVAHDPSV